MNPDAIKDGGAAYPVVHGSSNGDGSFTQNQGEQGMSLRDHFAGLAMPVILADERNLDYEQVAHHSYRMADAMIRAREA